MSESERDPGLEAISSADELQHAAHQARAIAQVATAVHAVYRRRWLDVEDRARFSGRAGNDPEAFRLGQVAQRAEALALEAEQAARAAEAEAARAWDVARVTIEEDSRRHGRQVFNVTGPITLSKIPEAAIPRRGAVPKGAAVRRGGRR